MLVPYLPIQIKRFNKRVRFWNHVYLRKVLPGQISKFFVSYSSPFINLCLLCRHKSSHADVKETTKYEKYLLDLRMYNINSRSLPNAKSCLTFWKIWEPKRKSKTQIGRFTILKCAVYV